MAASSRPDLKPDLPKFSRLLIRERWTSYLIGRRAGTPYIDYNAVEQPDRRAWFARS